MTDESNEGQKAFLDRINERDQRRKEQIALNKTDPVLVNYKKIILEKKAEIINSLKAFDPTAEEDLKTFISENNEYINQLTAQFNASSNLMSAYDQEKVIKELQDLRETISSYTVKVQPKKKFAFSKRKEPRVREQDEDQIPLQENQSSSANHGMNDLMVLGIGPDCYLGGQINGKDLRLDPKGENSTLLIENLDSCRVTVHCIPGNVYVKHVKKCEITFLRPIAGSLWLEDAHDSQFSIVTRQLRIHDTKNCRIQLFAASCPIIENSTGLIISEIYLPDATQAILDDFAKAKFPINIQSKDNKWREVNDFQQPTSRESGTSSNWKLDCETKTPYNQLC